LAAGKLEPPIQHHERLQMKRTLFAISVAALTLTGCTSAMDTALPPGRMNEAGTIRPCHRDHRDAQACGNAIFNDGVIAQIHTGQTIGDVRAIMRHEAERRTVAGVTESWGYITNYNDKVMTWIEFTDQKVTAITKQPWVRD
jgi:nitrous oxide reductase accessory protein NosL